MTARKLCLLLMVTLTIGACGSGGGGSDSSLPGGNAGTSPGGGDDGTGSGSGDGSADGDTGSGDGSDSGDEPGDGDAPPPSNTTSSAEILFPWVKSGATSSKVTIRGVASDADGIENVLVNGVAATITSVTSASAAFVPEGETGSTPDGVKAAKTASLPPTHATAAQEQVTWSAEIELVQGTNDVTVAVEDAGKRVELVDTATIDYVEVPVFFSLDTSSGRVVGISSTIRPPVGSTLVDYGYLSGQQRVYTETLDAVAAVGCFKSDTQDYLHLVIEPTDTVGLHSYNLLSEQDLLIDSVSLDPAAEGFANGPYLGNLACGAGHDSAYLLVNYANGNGFEKSQILEFDLVLGEHSVLTETDTMAFLPWIAFRIALTEDAIVSLRGLNGAAPLTSIALDSGTRSHLTPGLDVQGLALAPALEDGIVYVATFDGIDEVVVGANPTKRNVSVVDDSNPFVFSQIRSAAFDPMMSRVIVGDSDLDALIAVDVTTGARSELLAHRIGAGKRLIAPRALAVSADATKAYVGDDGSNAPEKLFEVDLASGDRRVIADIDQDFNVRLSGIALDEVNQRVYVSISNRILEVDLVNEVATTIASDTIGSGVLLEGISDLLLDAPSNRLLIADAGLEAVIELDLSTGARSTLSRLGHRGEGPAFENINSMTLRESPPRLFVANQLSETIMQVDPVSGDREVILDRCAGNFSSDVLGNGETLQQVLYNEITGELLILGDNLLGYNVATGQCREIQRFVGNPFLLDIQVTQKNQILAATFGALVQYDPISGESVIISK